MLVVWVGDWVDEVDVLEGLWGLGGGIGGCLLVLLEVVLLVGNVVGVRIWREVDGFLWEVRFGRFDWNFLWLDWLLGFWCGEVILERF